MKRLLIVLAVVTTFGLVGVMSASAADRHHGGGYRGHGRAHYVSPYNHGRRSTTYGYGRHHRPYNSGHHGTSNYGYGWSNYGHGGGYGHGNVHVSTPYFGLHIGH
ncbi:MAG: hypothetical protein H6822_02305 [Planctomycetaceae bacterium]|nr:hypothetical protein [Planctomycetales bacterium]MCB9920983.1 hypothetical protein [Planctomycetaceae bacterium]